jgi:site-specific recombinase XerD
MCVSGLVAPGPVRGLVFTTEFGGRVDPRNLSGVIEVAAKTAGLRGRRAHSAAVAWLEAGVHIKAVADLLGRPV